MCYPVGCCDDSRLYMKNAGFRAGSKPKVTALVLWTLSLNGECALSCAIMTMCVKVGIDSQRMKDDVLPFFGLSCHCNFVFDFVIYVPLFT